MNQTLMKVKGFLKQYKSIKKLYSMIRNPLRIKNIKKNGNETLSIINKVFSKTNNLYFIDFGTLLGFIREENFISHDLDIDIGVLYANKADKIVIASEMIKHGFVKTHEFEYENEIVEQAYIIKGVKVDLFYYGNSETNNFCYAFYKLPQIHYPNVNNFSAFRFDYEKIEGTETRVINGVKVSVPLNPEFILSQKYGVNWRIPDKSWEYSDSPSIKKLEGYGIMHIFN